MEHEPEHSEVDSCYNGVLQKLDLASPSRAPPSTSDAATDLEPECSHCSASPPTRLHANEETTGPASNLPSQLAQLRASNAALRTNMVALRMLAAEADRVTATLALLPPPQAPPPRPPPVSGNPSAIANQLLDLAFSEDYENDPNLENQYVSLPTEIMVAVEAAFRRRLAVLVSRWTREMGSRPSIERLLASAMRSRMNGTRALSLRCPETQAKLISAMMAEPGTTAAAAARTRLISLVSELGVNDSQRERLKEALNEFHGVVDDMKEGLAMAQLTAAVCLTAGENAAASAYRMLSLSLVAHNSVALTHSAAVLEQLQRRSLHAYLRLAAAVFGSLSSVQGARLLLGSLPYLPDHAGLCAIVCGEE